MLRLLSLPSLALLVLGGVHLATGFAQCTLDCTTDNDCSLNGACVIRSSTEQTEVDGLCDCDKGWTGDCCGKLDVDPTPTVAYGYGGPTAPPGTSSWGGGPPVFDGGKWHLFVSELAGHCGMGTWDRMSQAAHTVSDKMEGPYTRVGLAIPTQTHNTYYAYSAPDKMHLLYSIYSGTNPESCNPYKTCTNGTTPGHGGGVHPDSWKPEPTVRRTCHHHTYTKPRCTSPPRCLLLRLAAIARPSSRASVLSHSHWVRKRTSNTPDSSLPLPLPPHPHTHTHTHTHTHMHTHTFFSSTV